MKAPPNKTVRDVPGANQPHLQTSASSSNLISQQRPINNSIISGVSLSNLPKADKTSKPFLGISSFLKNISRSTGSSTTSKSNIVCTKNSNAATIVMVNGSIGSLNSASSNTNLHSNSHNHNCVVSTTSLGSSPSPEKPNNNFL